MVKNQCDQRLALIVHHLHSDGNMATHGIMVEAKSTAGPIQHLADTPLYYSALADDYTWSGNSNRISFQGQQFNLAEARLKQSGNRLQMDLECASDVVPGADQRNVAYRYAPEMVRDPRYVGPLASAAGMWVCESCDPTRYLNFSDGDFSVSFEEKDHWDDQTGHGFLQLQRDRSFRAYGGSGGAPVADLQSAFALRNGRLVARHGGEIFLSPSGQLVLKNTDLLGRRSGGERVFRRLSAAEAQAFETRTRKLRRDVDDAWRKWSMCVLDAGLKSGAGSPEAALNSGMGTCRSHEASARSVLEAGYGSGRAGTEMQRLRNSMREDVIHLLRQGFRMRSGN